VFAGFLLLNSSSAQVPAVVREWAVYAGNTTDSSFKIPVIILDGDAIVATFTLDSISGPDIKIIRYGGESVEGDVKWETTWTGSGNGRDVPTGLYIFDNAIYVCGISWTSTGNYDYVTLKLDDQGGIMWSQTYNGSASGYDVASALAVSNTGVFVTGTANNTGTSLDFTTICYDKDNGSQLWIAHHDYQSLMDIPFSLQLEGSNVIVVGACQETLQAWEYQGIIYEDNGNYYDSYNSSGSSSGFDRALAVCADSSGNVYITGAISTANEGFNIKTVKIEPGGHVAWEVEHDQSGGDDTGFDVMVDEDQNVYVCGSVSNHVNGSGDDFYLTKYTVNGQKDWDVLIDRENDVDIARALCMDSYGNIIVTGESYREDEQNMIFRPDFLTVGFTEAGEEIWRDYFGAVDKNDQATDIAADLNGNVYVTGNIGEDQDIQTVTIRYRTDYYTEPVTTEPASANFSYYENTGQLIDTEGGSPDYVHYYMPNHYPLLYFQNTSINMAWASIHQDTTVQDSMVRVDMAFFESEYNEKPAKLQENDSSNYINYYLGHCPDGITSYAHEKLLYSNVYPGIDVIFSSNAAGMKMYFMCQPDSDPSNIGLAFTGQDSFAIANNWSLRIETMLGSFDLEKPRVYQQDEYGNVSSLPWQLSWQIQHDTVGRFTNWGTYDTDEMLVIELGKAIQNYTGYPLPDWSTYIPGNEDDVCTNATTDNSTGDLFVTGYSRATALVAQSGPNSPTQSQNAGSFDVIILKFNSSGVLQWKTFYGGAGADYGYDIAHADYSQGRIFVVGSSASGTDFPTHGTSDPNCYEQQLFSPQMACVIQLDASDGSAKWSTLFGGQNVYGTSCTIDNNEHLIIGGFVTMYNHGINIGCSPQTTGSLEFPICDPGGNAYVQYTWARNSGQGVPVNDDGFLARFNIDGVLTWSTLFGGGENDQINDMAFDKLNNYLYVCGTTYSSGPSQQCTTQAVFCSPYEVNGCEGVFPLCDLGNSAFFGSELNSGAFGNSDAFITRFNSQLEVSWSTFFGSNLNDNATSIAVNSLGEVCISGNTYQRFYQSANCSDSPNSLFTGCFTGSQYNQTNSGGPSSQVQNDNYVALFDQNGEIKWSTFLGGYGPEGEHPSIAFDSRDILYVVGQTYSPMSSSGNNFHTNPSNFVYFQGSNQDLIHNPNAYGYADGYIASFNSDQQELWMTYFGGMGNDEIWGVTAFNDDALYIVGSTFSEQHFPSFINNPQIVCCSNTHSSVSGLDGFISQFNVSQLIDIDENKLINNLALLSFPNPTIIDPTL